MRRSSNRPYLVTLLALFGIWALAVTVLGKWWIFGEFWTMSSTMVFGSFIAGSSPAGGGAVAFPVFTKVLGVSPGEARTFSLMIQSVGMGMATLFILSRGIRIYREVLAIAIPAGIVGHTIGTLGFSIPYPYPRLLFTIIAAVLGISLFTSHWLLRWHPIGIDERFHLRRCSDRWHVVVIATLGGIAASMTGSGIDMLCFVLMALGFGLHEKRAIPTSVIAMAAISAYGFALRGLTGKIEPAVWNYWLACVPIVAVGAPLGAWVAAHIGRDLLMAGVLVLIAADLVTTLILIPIDRSAALFMVAGAVLTAIYLGTLLRRRELRRRSERKLAAP